MIDQRLQLQHMALIVSISECHACKSSEMVSGIVKIHVQSLGSQATNPPWSLSRSRLSQMSQIETNTQNISW